MPIFNINKKREKDIEPETADVAVAVEKELEKADAKAIPLNHGLGRPRGSRKKAPTVITSVVFREDQYIAVRRLAAIEGRTLRDMIHILLEEALKKHVTKPLEI